MVAAAAMVAVFVGCPAAFAPVVVGTPLFCVAAVVVIPVMMVPIMLCLRCIPIRAMVRSGGRTVSVMVVGERRRRSAVVAVRITADQCMAQDRGTDADGHSLPTMLLLGARPGRL